MSDILDYIVGWIEVACSVLTIAFAVTILIKVVKLKSFRFLIVELQLIIIFELTIIPDAVMWLSDITETTAVTVLFTLVDMV